MSLALLGPKQMATGGCIVYLFICLFFQCCDVVHQWPTEPECCRGVLYRCHGVTVN